MNRQTRLNANNDAKDLNYAIDSLELKDFFQTLHPSKAKHIFQGHMKHFPGRPYARS